MPYIRLTTNKKISEEQKTRLEKSFGLDIEKIPGKSERWLMVALDDGVSMCMAGDGKSDTAMIDVSIFGTASRRDYENLTAALTDSASDILSIPPDRIYIKYGEYSVWGFAGSNF